MTAPTLHRLEDLILRPELLAPPASRLPRHAWGGRTSLLAAAAKSGKSTLAGQGIAAGVTGELFLGERVAATRTLILGLDEALAETVRRLASFGAERDVLLMTERPAADELQRIITGEGVDLVVIDSLSEFARGIVEDYNSASQWTPLLGSLRRTAQETDAGILMLHHVTKGPNGRYRDSSAIGAGVDVIIESLVDESDPTVRKVRARGRFPMTDFNLRYTNCRYALEGGELPLEMRVYRAIEAEPGISLGALRGRVQGASTAIDAALADLFHRRAIADRGDKTRRAFYTCTERAGSEGAEMARQASGKLQATPHVPQLSDCKASSGNPTATSQATAGCPPLINKGAGQPPAPALLEAV